MIPYELIVPSASRPKLLGACLISTLARVDQPPKTIIVHDDVVKPETADEVRAVCEAIARSRDIPLLFEQHRPPLSHGPSLHKLLARVSTEYVLYTQDDQFVERDVPVRDALALMHAHTLHQIRFNKRATMEWKSTWQKREFHFGHPNDLRCNDGAGHRITIRSAAERVARGAEPLCDRCGVPAHVVLTVADHWYFQLGLWRVSRIKPVVDWFIDQTSSFNEHAEIKTNKAMNRGIAGFNGWALSHGYELPEQECYSMDQDVRARVQRTFIWGPIGEPRFTDNLAVNPEDWRLIRPRGGTGPSDVDSQANERGT